MGWISVDDRLPELDEQNCSIDVIFTEHGRVFFGYVCFSDGVFRNLVTDDYYHDVTHWQPLPEPPK